MTQPEPATLPPYIPDGITQLVESIAHQGNGITYHPEEKHRAAIEHEAARLGLTAVPDFQVPYRNVRPVNVPPPTPALPPPASAAGPFLGADVADAVVVVQPAAVEAVALVVDELQLPAEFARNRTARRILASLAVDGWVLVRLPAAAAAAERAPNARR